MPTVIDSLVVELGLDPSNFNLQQREALETAKRLEAQQLKSAKNIEQGAGRAAGAIGDIRTQALQMFAVFAGGQGVLTFTNNMVHANAQLGRMERNLNISGAVINKWQGVARIFGGDAQAMAQSFTTISDAFAGWQIGKVSPLIADLRAISTAGGKVIDVNKGVEQSMLDLAENLKRIHDSGPEGPARAALLGRQVGIDPGLYDAMITGSLPKVLEYMDKINKIGKDQLDTFGELEKRMNSMGEKAQSLGRKALTGENGKGGLASMIMEWADVLNMTPGEAWKFLNRTDRNELRNGTKQEAGAPGQAMFPSASAFTSQAEKEQFIRSEAAKRGINPNVAMAVARSEGFNNSVGDNGTSFGAFQLHVTAGGKGNAVGDQFRSATGLDPSNPANEKAGIMFALDDVRKNGWSAYHGAANSNIDRWAGVDRGAGSNSSTTVTIGSVTVTPPQGSDPNSWASSFAAAVARQSFAAQSNGGQN